MALMTGNFAFTGTLGNISVYKRHGSEHPIARTKGGPSKHRYKNSPTMEVPRQNGVEFGGRSTCGKWIRNMLAVNNLLADPTLTGRINGLLKPVQDLDTGNAHGKRSIMVYRNPQLLNGFSLNNLLPFDSIVRSAATGIVSRDTLSARLELPSLLPGINFFVPGRYPLFSISAVLGIIPGFTCQGKHYYPAKGYSDQHFMNIVFSDWYPSTESSPALSLDMKITAIPPDSDFSLMLSVGISFGTIGAGNSVKQVRRAGSAKIVQVV